MLQAARQGQKPALAKAGIEVGVQVVGRWILARLRHQRFFSLAGAVGVTPVLCYLFDQKSLTPRRLLSADARGLAYTT